MKEFILQHYNDYPKSEIQDFFKFLHQSEFGPGHLIADKSENFKRLQSEFENLDKAVKEPVIDILQPHLCRLHLQVLNQTTLAMTTLQRFFEISAMHLQGDVEIYFKKIDLLKKMCANGDLPFAISEVDIFKTRIELTPTKPFRHSNAYRETYAPAYRVVDKKFFDFLDLFAAIDGLMATAIDGDCANAQNATEDHFKPIVVAIDGDCASGKTTLSGLLTKVYDCNIIHIDHFFLRPEQRTEERLAMPGGNIDHERFSAEVLDKLKNDAPFSYRPFNCMTQDFDAPIPLSPQKLTIVEGSYSQHPELVHHYDLKVFLTVPEDVQLERILKRNGEVMYEKFKNLWIPMEKKYAETFDIQGNSDLVFDYLSSE